MIWRLSLRGRPPRGLAGSAGSSGPMRAQSVSGTVAKRASMGRAFHQIPLKRAKFSDRLYALCGGATYAACTCVRPSNGWSPCTAVKENECPNPPGESGDGSADAITSMEAATLSDHTCFPTSDISVPMESGARTCD